MSRKFANRVVILLLVAMAVSIVGCAQARWVERSGSEGTIAIPYNNNTNREEAYKMALEAWPGGYELVWEKEVPIGTTTSTRSAGREHTDSAAVGATSTSGGTTVGAAAGHSTTTTRGSATTSTRVDTEYHIKFKAK